MEKLVGVTLYGPRTKIVIGTKITIAWGSITHIDIGNDTQKRVY